MTKQEKKRLSSVLRATEYLFLENISLKLVLEHREVPNWQKLLDHLLADKEMLAGVRLKFRDVYKEIAGSADVQGNCGLCGPVRRSGHAIGGTACVEEAALNLKSERRFIANHRRSVYRRAFSALANKSGIAVFQLRQS